MLGPANGAGDAGSSSDAPTLGVIVATFRRPDDLRRCLDALRGSERAPDAILVVSQSHDELTRAVLAADAGSPARPGVTAVLVDRPGTVAARNAALDVAPTDLVAIIDDDTAVAPDWSRRIVAHFAADPSLGGLGGRDRCHDGDGFDDRRAEPVGRVQWFGRLIGNHHLGFGAPRPVEWLKGANMAFRRAALGGIRFDGRLRGSRAQPAEDVAFSLAVRKAGWRMLYDPAVSLDHYASRRDEVRHYVARGGLADPDGFYDFCFNNVVAVWPYLSPGRRVAHAIWSVAVGISLRPGMVQVIRLLPAQRGTAIRRFAIAQRAQFDASRLMLRDRPRRQRRARPPRARALDVAAGRS